MLKSRFFQSFFAKKREDGGVVVTPPPPPPPPPIDDGTLGPITVAWTWVGNTTSTSTQVNARITSGTAARLVLYTDAAFTNPVKAVNANVDTTNGQMAKFIATGLTPNTKYYYRVIGSNVGKEGSLRTFPGVGQPTELVSSSCGGKDIVNDVSNHWVYTKAVQLHPNLSTVLHLGDMHYRDIQVNNSTTPDLYRAAITDSLTQPNQGYMYANVNVSYMYDDHDFGPNNSHSLSSVAPVSKRIYREMVPHYPILKSLVTGNTPTDTTLPAGQTFVTGDVRVMMMDGRAGKLENNDPNLRTMWGTAQTEWFYETLAAATEPVIIINVGNSWISNETDQSDATVDPVTKERLQTLVAQVNTGGDARDNWYTYYKERRRIANFLMAEENRKNGVLLNDRVIIIHSDAHMLAFDDGSNSQYADGFVGKVTPGDSRTVYKGPLCLCTGPWDANTSYKGYPYEVNGVLQMKSFRGQYAHFNFVPNGGVINFTCTGFQVTGTTGANRAVQMTVSKTYSNQYYPATLPTQPTPVAPVIEKDDVANTASIVLVNGYSAKKDYEYKITK